MLLKTPDLHDWNHFKGLKGKDQGNSSSSMKEGDLCSGCFHISLVFLSTTVNVHVADFKEYHKTPCICLVLAAAE